MKHSVILSCLILSLLGCSAGKHHDSQVVANHSAVSSLTSKHSKISHKPIPINNMLSDYKKQHSVFAHPGLIFVIDWGESRALKAAKELTDYGYYDDVLEIRDRKYPLMYKQMLKEKKPSYLGIHFSLGGYPEVLSEALKATHKASIKLNKTIVYNAILVDPYGLSEFSQYIKPYSSHLGTVYIIASSNYSFLRPSMKLYSKKVLNQHNIHYVYPEDFGLSWDHFGFLSAITNTDKNSTDAKKIQGIFYFLVNSIQQKADSKTIRSGLNELQQRIKGINNN